MCLNITLLKAFTLDLLKFCGKSFARSKNKNCHLLLRKQNYYYRETSELPLANFIFNTQHVTFIYYNCFRTDSIFVGFGYYFVDFTVGRLLDNICT
jgi:hypothetical protein